MNEGSIGIEIINATLGQEDNSYTEAQIITLIDLCKKLMQKYDIKPWNVVGHSDVAPSRKADPGCAFPWQRLAESGIGIWYQKEDKIDNDAVSLLQKIGYDVSCKEAQIASAYAFRRHYMPREVDVISNLQELLDNPYPKGDESWLSGEHILAVLNAVVCNKK